MIEISDQELEKKNIKVLGKNMSYVEKGEGDPIIFQHGNPTSSYLWRNIMPHMEGRGRLIACDLIGMGDSEKLSNTGPDSYTYFEQRDFLFQLLERLNIGNNVIFVIHDWGSALGFDWSFQNQERVQGIAYMEAIVRPVSWDEWPENATRVFPCNCTSVIARSITKICIYNRFLDNRYQSLFIWLHSN